MSKKTSNITRIQSFVLALLVLTLSSGFTYRWQGCLHADAEPICTVVDQTCCCSQTPQTTECLCADIGDKSCEWSFSKYIQFNFETQLSDPLELQTKLAIVAKALYRFGSNEPLLQNKSLEVRYSKKSEFNDDIIKRFFKKKIDLQIKKFDNSLLHRPFFLN